MSWLLSLDTHIPISSVRISGGKQEKKTHAFLHYWAVESLCQENFSAWNSITDHCCVTSNEKQGILPA